jgi:hypothetical protein
MLRASHVGLDDRKHPKTKAAQETGRNAAAKG